MAIPDAPVTPNASKLHYLLYDNSGTNAAAIWHSVDQLTVNSEVTGVAHVGTHIVGATLGSDAVVAVAGVDGTTLRAIAVNADGEVGIHDGGNSITVDGTIVLDAGTANIGDVDVLTVPAPLSTTGGGTEATALRVTLANDSTGVVAVTQSGTWNLTNISGTISLPTGAATAALQTQPGVDIGDVTINNAAGAAAVNIQDGGNSITVDGTIAATQSGSWDIGTVTTVTAVTAITNALPAGTNNIGDVDVLTVPAPLSTTGAGTEATALRVTLANDSTGLLSVDDNGGSLTVDAPVGTPVNVQIGDGTRTATVRDTGTSDSLNVAIVDASGNQITTFGGTGGTSSTDDGAFTAGSGLGTPMMGFATTDAVDAGDVGVVGMTAARGLYTNIRDDAGDSCMDGTNNALRVNIVAGSSAGTEYTEGDVDASITGTAMLMEGAADTLLPIQGTVADGLLVNLGANNDVTVTGSVTANAGTNLNTSLLALESGGNLAGAATSLAILDDWDESDRAKVNPIAGQAGVQGGSGTVTALTQRVVLATDVALPAGTNNIGDVDVLTMPAVVLAAGTANIGDVDVLTVPAPLSTTGGGTEATALRVTIATDSTGVLSVDDNGGSLTVDGTVAISGTVTASDICNTSTLATAVSVTTSATALPASALSNRKRIVVQNKSTTQSIFVGGSGVTTVSGMEIPVGWAQSFEAGPSNGLFAIVASGSEDVRVLELS